VRAAGQIAIAGLLALAVALAVYWALARGLGGPGGPQAPPAPEPAASRAADPAVPAAPPEAPAPTRGVRAPAERIADQGRLRVTREALREGDVLALGLALPDALRGDGPRPVKVVDVTGRVLEASALPVDGSGSGLRLEIDPEWLRPGRYMIQVETEGGAPLRLRRYVLEVSEPGAEPGS
jgi:hypothetical protein